MSTPLNKQKFLSLWLQRLQLIFKTTFSIAQWIEIFHNNLLSAYFITNRVAIKISYLINKFIWDWE